MEHSRLLKFLLPESDTNVMAEEIKIKFDYKNPENVDSEVPGAQKIREVLSNETGEILRNNAEKEANNANNGANNANDGANNANDGANNANDEANNANAASNDAKHGANNAENSKENLKGGEVLGTSKNDISDTDGQVVTRRRRYYSGKRIAIHGEPVMLEKHLENAKAKTKIPVSRFKQTVEKVKEDRRNTKKEHESHIPVRRQSHPKLVKDQKVPNTTVKKETTITKTKTTSESEPIRTKTVFTKQLSEPASSKTDIKTDVIEPEDEFDKIYAEIVESAPTDVILDDSLLNAKVDDPEKLEIKFEEIIHDYDEHKIEPINVEVVKRSKIPHLKRKSQHDVELNAQTERTNKIIAARDKLRLRNSLTKNGDFEKELDEELNNTRKADDTNDKAPSKTDTKTEKEIKHEIITTPNSKTEIKREFSKTISTSSSKENENFDSTSVIETTVINEVTTNKSKDMKENKQYVTEENIVKGLPVLNSYVHEFSENNESTKTVEVTKVLSYTTSNDDLSITKDISENKQEAKIIDNILDITQESVYNRNISENVLTNKVSEIKQEYKNNIFEVQQGNHTNNISEMVQEANKTGNISKVLDEANNFVRTSKTDKAVKMSESDKLTNVTEKKIEQNELKYDESFHNDVQFRSKIERVASKIDSKEIIETDKNERESINELKKKKAVMSKIAMFEQKETEKPFPSRNLKKENKLPKLVTKDWQKVDNVHIHTPLIVDEVHKPFDANIAFNDKENKVENPTINNEELTTIVTDEKITVQSSDTVHYATENKVQIETKTVDHKVIEEILPQAKIDSEYIIQKVEMTTVTDESSKRSFANDVETNSYKNAVNNIPKATKLSITKELQPPVVIPGFKPVSELLKSFEYKNETSKNVPKELTSKVEYSSTVIEMPLRKSEIILTNQDLQSEISTNQEQANEILRSDINGETYDDFDYVNDFKSLDDVFARDDVFNLGKNYDDMKRAKSLAELDIGEAVKGKVGNLIIRMTSFDKMALEKKDLINQKEMPRKRSVSEKIALFEGLTPVRTETHSLRIFKFDNLTDLSRTEKKIDRTPRMDMKEYRTELQSEKKSLAEKTEDTFQETEIKEQNDEEVIQNKIEELRSAKIKYGTVDNMPKIELSNGVTMPVFALGTALLDSRLIYHIVSAAIDLGYRAIDTAFIYGNEKQVGEAIKAKIADGTVKREELFIISKLWSTYHRTDLVEVACRASLETMGLDYFDLYLIHNPMSFKEGGAPIPKIATVIQFSEYDYLDAWFGMESLVAKGLVRAIGVSNFNSVQLQRVLDKGKIKPVVNQVECHPYLSQQRLDLFCSERNVTLSCFGTLGSKGTPMELKNCQPAVIDDPLVKVMASGLEVTPAQLLISYQLENGHGVVVKASSAGHLKDNLNAMHVHLTMGQIDALHALNRNKRMFTFKGMGDTHKNYPFNIPF